MSVTDITTGDAFERELSQNELASESVFCLHAGGARARSIKEALLDPQRKPTLTQSRLLCQNNTRNE